MYNKKNLAYHVRFNFDNLKPLVEKNNQHTLSLHLPPDEEIPTPVRKKIIPSKNYQTMISGSVLMFFISQIIDYAKSDTLDNIKPNSNTILNGLQQILNWIMPTLSSSSNNFSPKI